MARGGGVKLIKLFTVIAVCVMVTACSSTRDPVPTVAPQITLPEHGTSLQAYGLTHDPASLVWLPESTTVTYSADQANLLIVSGPVAQAQQVENYLSETLPGLGWTITSQVEGALLFDSGIWQGAYVVGDESWALTVRND